MKLLLAPLIVSSLVLSFSADAATVTSVSIPGRGAKLSSPVIADIDGNPANGLEIAVSGADGLLSVFRGNGELLWSVGLPNRSCNAETGTKVSSSPAVGRLLGDGVPYVVVGYGGMSSRVCGGGVAAYHGPTGSLFWHFDLKRFARKARFGTLSNSVFSTPALADSNGDGQLEVGFGSFDRHVYLLSARGRLIWYYQAADTIWSSAAFADLDGAPGLEMAIGTDISENKRLKPPTANGGFLYAFRSAGSASARRIKYGFRDSRAFLWSDFFDQVIFSAPVIADLLPASPGLEVSVGSGCFFPQGSKNKNGKWLRVVSGPNGQLLRTLETTACSTSSPAVGDVDGDGLLELVTTVNGNRSIGGNGSGTLTAWKVDSAGALWSLVPRSGTGSNNSYLGNFNSPVIADLDRNGSLEVLVANRKDVIIYQGSSGALLGHLNAGEELLATPAIADVDGTGLPVVVAAGRRLHFWRDFSGLGSSPGSLTPGAISWAMFRGNARRTGSYGD